MFKKNIYSEPIVHILFWLIYFFYPYLQFGDHHNFSFDYNRNLITLIFNVFVVYMVYLVLLPRFIKVSNDKKLKIVILTLLVLVFIAWANCKIDHHISGCNCIAKVCVINKWLSYLSLIGVFSAFYLFKKYQQNLRDMETAMKEKHLSELETLKAQVNPHFMLNTLNAIYSYFVLKNISPVASKLIYQFADNFRYLVNEGRQKKVTIGREVAHIENYINLQKFRLEEKVDVSFDKNISDEKIQMPPLLLINFIENSFKHTNDLKGQHHKIEISIKEDNGVLYFVSINPFIENSVDDRINKGTGLKNALKRLELEFPNKHKISIITKDNLFKVDLTIELI